MVFLKRREVLFSLFVVILAGPVQAEKHTYITPKIGFSAMTGVIGLEVQHQHFALDVGFPAAGGIRYYTTPNGHSWFGGLYGMGYGLDQDETKDGVTYTHYSTIHGGMAGGYRWLWRSRWSLELGLAVGAGEQHWSNSTFERTEKNIFFWPVAAFGIAF